MVKNKTVCVHHSADLDGWTSGAIVKMWGEDNQVEIDFIGYNYEEELPDLSQYDKVIMTDCSFPLEEMIKLKEEKNSFLLFDHHASKIKEIQESGIMFEGVQQDGLSASELIWDYFYPDLLVPPFVFYIGMWDTFRHKGTNHELLCNHIQYGARYYINSVYKARQWLLSDIYDLVDAGVIIYTNLCAEARQTYENERFTINYMGKKFAAVNRVRMNPGSLGIDYTKDGYDGFMSFHFEGKEWKFSVYSESDAVNCYEIAKSFGGGGHYRASGFRVTFEQLKKLLQQ